MATAAVVETRTRPPLPRLSWRLLLVFAALSTVACAAMVIPANVKTDQGTVALVSPAADGPSTGVFRADFPNLPLEPGLGADGQMFYAVARAPMHLADAVPFLDRPRYRAQRILMPVLAWALHPSGGGWGLVVALVIVNLAGVFVGALSAGALTQTLGGAPHGALIYGALPGTLMCLNLGVPDALALGLVLAAITFDLRGRPRSAIAAGVAAVLAKESMLLVLVGYALWRRDRRAALFAGIPVAVAGAWWAWLRLVLPRTMNESYEFDPVFGLVRSAREWVQGHDTDSLVFVAIAVVLALLALRRGAWRGPFGIAIVLQLAFMATLSINVLKTTYNITRAGLPLVVIAGIALLVSLRRDRDTVERERWTSATH
jgi:hypothetical protein